MPDYQYRYLRRKLSGSIGRAWQTARLERGMSQEEVASAAGIATYTYGCLERAASSDGPEVNPTLDTLIRISVILDVDLRDLPD